jgi:protein TonB
LDPLRYYTTPELDVRPWIKERIEPEYPEKAYRRFLSGKVVVQLYLDESGKVERAVAVRADPGGYFEEAAEKAFLAARFTPGMKGGRPVKVRMQMEVSFESARPLEPGRPIPRS